MSDSRHRYKSPERILPLVLDYCAQNVPIGIKSQRSRTPSPEQKRSYNSPATSETRRQPNSHLTNAYKQGALEAQKVKQIIEKKKDEIGIQLCETSKGNTKEKYDLALQSGRDIEEELREKILCVKDLDNEGENFYIKNSQAMESIKIKKTVQDIQTKPSNEQIQPISPNCSSNVRLVTPNNVAIQYNSIFTTKCHETQRCIDVQCPENDRLYHETNTTKSDTSVQCYTRNGVLEGKRYSQVSLQNDVTYQNISSSSITDSTGRLKYILKKLICKRRYNHENTWKKYVNDLKNRHRPHNQVQSTNESFYCSDHGRIPISPVSLPRRVQSTFVLDELSSCGISSNRTSSQHKKYHDINSLRCSSLTRDIGYPKFDYFSPREHIIPPLSPPFESREKRINPFCYPSLLTDSMVAKPKMRKLCRDINNAPLTPEKLTGFSLRPKTEQKMYEDNDFNTEYLNRWLEKPSFRGKNRYTPEIEMSNRHYNSYLDNVNLQAVPEEPHIVSTKQKSKESSDAYIKTENCKKSKTSLSAIENKLDTLIESIHALVSEVKQSRTQQKKMVDKRSNLPPLTKFDCIRYLKHNENIIKSKSDPVKISAGDKLLQSVGEMILGNSDINVHGIISPHLNKGCEIQVVVSSKTRTKSTNTSLEPNCRSPTYPKDVFVTDKVKEKQSRNHYVKCEEYPHALQLTVDFLVKDNPKQRHPEIKKADTKPFPSDVTNRCVNTEPMSLGQISQEAFKCAWSVRPLVEYFWSFLPVPPLFTSTKYVCEICKQSFDGAFELSEHIKIHYADEKDCLICRQLTSDGNKRTIRAVVPLPNAFACQHCGQTFCRAYARQLHEASCKQNNRSDSGKKSLVILS